MAKCMMGEKAAEFAVQVIRENSGRTSNDLAALINSELELAGRSATLTSTVVNSFLSYHPDGQALVAEGLVARERSKMPPQWADANTPVAESMIRKIGQLVPYAPTDVAHIDGVYGAATATMNRLAKALPNSRQRDVLAVVNTLNMSANRMELAERTIARLLNGDRPTAPKKLVDAND